MKTRRKRETEEYDDTYTSIWYFNSVVLHNQLKKVIASVISFLDTFFFQFVDNVLIESIFTYPQIDNSKNN